MADYATWEQVIPLAHEADALSTTGQDLLLTAASRLFDKQVGVPDDFFSVGDVDAPITYSNRDFIGDGTAYLKLDPYLALNPTDPVLVNDDTILDPDFTSSNVPEYVARNGMLVVLGRTIYRNFSPTGINRFQGWPDGRQIRVSANWGFSAIPADVTVAVAHIVLALWRTGDPAFSVISNAEGAATRIETIPKVARDIITEYKEKYSRAALFA